MDEQVEWQARKISLGNAIIVAVVTLVFGVVIGLNWKYWFNKS